MQRSGGAIAVIRVMLVAETILLGLLMVTFFAISIWDASESDAISSENMQKVTLVAVGFVLGGLIPLSVRAIAADIKMSEMCVMMADLDRKIDLVQGELRKPDVMLLEPHIFARDIALRIGGTRHLHRETVLSWDHPDYLAEGRSFYAEERDRRIMYGTLSFSQIVVVRHERHLRMLLREIGMFKNKHYSVRVYEAAGSALPPMNFMAFDNRYLYVGGFPREDAGRSEAILFIDDHEVYAWFDEYWNTLSRRATVLVNDGRRMLEEIRNLAVQCGLREDDHDLQMALKPDD